MDHHQAWLLLYMSPAIKQVFKKNQMIKGWNVCFDLYQISVTVLILNCSKTVFTHGLKTETSTFSHYSFMNNSLCDGLGIHFFVDESFGDLAHNGWMHGYIICCRPWVIKSRFRGEEQLSGSQCSHIFSVAGYQYLGGEKRKLRSAWIWNNCCGVCQPAVITSRELPVYSSFLASAEFEFMFSPESFPRD